MKTRTVLLALTVVPLLSAAARGEYVVNGSLTGPAGTVLAAPWQTGTPGLHSAPLTVEPGGYADAGGVLAPDMPASPDGGTFWVAIIDDLGIVNYAWQEISGLSPGASYTLSFYFANAGQTHPLGFSNDPGAFTASIAGQEFETATIEYEGAGQQTWHLASFDFIATQPTELLAVWNDSRRFWGAIDGISIVPEPGGFLLAAFGVAACLAARWRATPRPHRHP